MTTVEFGCSACHRPVEGEPGETVTCARCDGASTLAASDDVLTKCLACGCEELYRHRDFNQKLGIAIIVIGVVVCFLMTSFLPLLIAAAIDLLLYYIVPDVAICYHCKAHHRGFVNVKQQGDFDLERHEHYRFVRAREEGRIPQKEE